MTDYKRTYSQRGDDYLLEARKVCKKEKPAPRCPYCGHKMGRYYAYDDFFFRCPKCRVASPDRDTEAEAYEAAMQRWQEPNRVLAMEDLALLLQDALAGVPVWLQHKDDTEDYLRWRRSGWHILTDVHTERKEILFDNDILFEDTNMGIMWRVWLRQPTQKEMEAVPWEKP